MPNAGSPAVALDPGRGQRAGYYNPRTCGRRASASPGQPAGDGKTSIRGGVGLFYDRPEGNLYFSLVNNPPFSLSSSYENGNLANPGGGAVAALAPWASMDALDPEPEDPARVELEPRACSASCRAGACSARSRYVGDRRAEPAPPARHQPPDVRRPSAANAGGPEVQHELPAAVQGLLEHPHAPDRRQLELQRAADVPEQAPRATSTSPLNYTLLARRMTTAAATATTRHDGGLAGPRATTGARADNDRRHIFVGTWTYRLPFWLKTARTSSARCSADGRSRASRASSRARRSRVTGNTSIGAAAPTTPGDEHVSRRAASTRRTAPAVAEHHRVHPGPRGPHGQQRRATSSSGPAYHAGTSRCASSSGSRATWMQFQADFFNAFNNVNLRNPADERVQRWLRDDHLHQRAAAQHPARGPA